MKCAQPALTQYVCTETSQGAHKGRCSEGSISHPSSKRFTFQQTETIQLAKMHRTTDYEVLNLCIYNRTLARVAWGTQQKAWKDCNGGLQGGVVH